MSKKGFLKNVLLFQALNFAVKPLWILWIDREIQNRLPAEAYGNYFSLFSFSLLFLVLLDLGMTNYSNKSGAADQNFTSNQFGKLLPLKLLLSLGYLVLLFLAAQFIYHPLPLGMLFLLGINQILVNVTQFFRSQLSANQRFAQDAVASVVDKSILIVLGVWLLYFAPEKWENIWGFVWIQTLGYALALMVVMAMTRGLKIKMTFNFQGAMLWTTLKKAFPYALLAALMMSYTRIDAVMLTALLPNGDFEAGRYAMAYRLLDAAVMVPALISGMLLSFFSRQLAEGESPFGISRLAFKMLVLPGFATVCALTFFAEEWMLLLYPQKSELSVVEIFISLMCTFPFVASVYVYGTLLTAADELKKLNVFACIALALNMVLNAVLIPTYGAEGAAITTLATQSVFGLLCMGFAYRILKFKVEWKPTLIVLGWGILVLALFMAPNIQWEWWLNAIGKLGLALLLVPVFGIFKWRQLLHFAKGNEID